MKRSAWLEGLLWAERSVQRGQREEVEAATYAPFDPTDFDAGALAYLRHEAAAEQRRDAA